MSGFTANAPAVAPEADVIAGSFWPAVKLRPLREAMRLDGSVTTARLRVAVVAAMLTVGDELAQWRVEQQARGYAALADVPSDEVDGSTRHLQLFLRAVQCAAAVELSERYRSYDATAQGNQRAEDLTPTIDDLRRDQRYAISDFLGRRRVTVALI
jgi:head completion protein GPL